MGGDQIDGAVGLAGQVVQRVVEGLGGEGVRPVAVEHRELRIEAGRQRVGAQDPGTEAVDRRDERPLGLAGGLVGAELA